MAGAAGLVLGNGILFPGTYKRLQSMMQGAKDGVKIIIGLLPVFITAAFFEGYVTRHTGMPIWLSLLILLSSLIFVCWYFLIYPARLQRSVSDQLPRKPGIETDIHPENIHEHAIRDIISTPENT